MLQLIYLIFKQIDTIIFLGINFLRRLKIVIKF